MRQFFRRRINMLFDMGEQSFVPDLRHHRFPRDHIGLQEGMETHNSQPHTALALGGIFRFRHFVGRALDEVFQHIVQKTHHVVNKVFVLAPLHELLGIERRQAAHSRALLAEMVFARWQRNFGAQIGSFNFQIEQFLMLGTQIIHRVFEHHIRLARLNTRGQHADPQIARLQRRLHRAVARAAERPFFVALNRPHKGI